MSPAACPFFMYVSCLGPSCVCPMQASAAAQPPCSAQTLEVLMVMLLAVMQVLDADARIFLVRWEGCGAQGES